MEQARRDDEDRAFEARCSATFVREQQLATSSASAAVQLAITDPGPSKYLVKVAALKDNKEHKEAKKAETVSLVKAPTAASKRNGPATKLSKKQPPPIPDGSLEDEDLDIEIDL